MADPADAEEETIEALPEEMKKDDQLMGASVSKKIDGQVHKGCVEDIEVGQISRDRLYRVRYTDGDLEHMTESEIRQVLVALQGDKASENDQQVMKKPATKKSLEVVAEEDVEMGAPEEDVTMKKPAGRAKAKAKAKAKADPIVQEEQEDDPEETAEKEEKQEEVEEAEIETDWARPGGPLHTTDAMGSDDENPSVQHTTTSGSDSSDCSEESVYPPSSNDLEGVLVAFCAMEYRRLRRIRNGRIVKDGLGRHLNSAMKGIIASWRWQLM
eukprot:symbB.v1.2.041096.t2/scaffold7820.1/size9155/2